MQAPTLRATLRRWDALAFAACVRILLAALLGLPVIGALLATGIGNHPHADAEMFAPGGLMLVEGVRLLAGALVPLTRITLLLFVLATLASLCPIAVLLVAFSEQKRSFPDAFRGGLARLPTCFAIYGLCLLIQVLVLAATSMVASTFPQEFASSSSSAWADGLAVLLVALGVALNCVIGIARDLSFAASTRMNTGALRSLLAGVGALLAHPFRIAVDWARFAAWQAVFLLGAAWLVGAMPMVGGAWSLAANAVHCAALLLLVVLRAAWSYRTLVHVNADAVNDYQPAATIA